MNGCIRGVLTTLTTASAIFLCVLLTACGNEGTVQRGKGIAQYHNPQADIFFTEWTLMDAVRLENNNEALRSGYEHEPVNVEDLWLSAAEDQMPLADGQQHAWKTIRSDSNQVDLEYHLGSVDYAYTYAAAEITSNTEVNGYFGVGSDDGIKIWLNGVLIHDNYVFRGVVPDQDIVPFRLKKGSNQLIVKVLDGAYGWGFTLRPISVAIAEKAFVDLSPNLSASEIDGFLQFGVDINAKNNLGLTALHLALQTSDEARVRMLLEDGADPGIPIPDTKTQIENYFKSATNPGSSGFSYLVAQDGEILTKGGVGLANVKKGTANTTETKFRAGSITKQFTAVSILQLQERGLLSLSDSLIKYFPDYSDADQVTLRHLLNHTSGIFVFNNDAEMPFTADQHVEPERLLNIFKNHGFSFKPGEQWRYSSSGYFVLGLIVEKVSGLSLNEYMQANIFEPLGMENSGLYDNNATYPNEALGYTIINGAPIEALDADMSTWNGAAALYTTVEDLFIWNQALHNGRVLSPASYLDAITPVEFNGGFKPFVSYGLGLAIEQVAGKKAIGHPGSTSGFHSELFWLPAEKVTFIYLSNTDFNQLKISGKPSVEIFDIMFANQ